jgi:anti-sigma factor RsiW
MCPDPQLLSIYMDGELPSPWKEKMESHLSECSECMGKYKNFKRLKELLKKDTSQKRTIVESSDHVSEEFSSEQELMEASMKRVWQKLEARSNVTYSYRIRSAGTSSYGMRRQLRPDGISRQTENLWKRRLSVPLPAAAAAAIIIAFVTAAWFRGGSANNNAFANRQAESGDKSNFIMAAEEEVSGIIPTGNISDVLQYLSSNGTEIIILQLPESSNFSRAGEPAIIRAADYTRRDQ